MRDPYVQQQFNHVFDASDADFDAMFARLGWLAPYYLKIVANEVRPSVAGEKGGLPRATAADFDAAFDRLLQPNRRSEFAVWREHVQKNLPAGDRQTAMQTLHFLSATESGEQVGSILAHLDQHGAITRRPLLDVLSMLANDGLIMKASDRYRFRSGLVRQYWNDYEAE